MCEIPTVRNHQRDLDDERMMLGNQSIILTENSELQRYENAPGTCRGESSAALHTANGRRCPIADAHSVIGYQS